MLVSITKRSLLSAIIVSSFSAAAIAQNPPAAPPKKGATRLILWVTSPVVRGRRGSSDAQCGSG